MNICLGLMYLRMQNYDKKVYKRCLSYRPRLLINFNKTRLVVRLYFILQVLYFYEYYIIVQEQPELQKILVNTIISRYCRFMIVCGFS